MDAPPTAPVVASGAQPPTRASRLFCAGCGLSVLTLSLAVLLGWALGLLTLEQVAPGLPAMTPDTAVGLGCAGLALAGLAGGRRRRVAGRCLGAIAATIGLLVIVEYLVAPIGIDQLLFTVPGAIDPGRPSPHTAVALLALGLAFASCDLPRLPAWVHQALLAVSAAVATSALVGYIYDVDYLRGVSGSDGMAVHTLVAVIILTIGAVMLHPDGGLPGMMRGDGGGAIVARAVIPLGLTPLTIGTVLFVLQQHGVVGLRLAMSLFTLAMVSLLVVVMIVTTVRARQADRRAREVSGRLRAVFDHLPAAVSLRGLDGRYLELNQASADVLGSTVSELLGTRPDEMSIAAPLRADDLEMRRTGKPVIHEQRVPHVDGHQIDYQVIRYPVLDRDGDALAFGTFAFDITEQKRTIEALEVAQTRFRAMFEEAPIGMAVLGLDGGFEQVNDALCAILGHPREQLEGMSSETFMDRHDLATSLVVRREMLDGETDSRIVEARYRHATGRSVVVDVHIALLRDPAGLPMHFLVQVQDITERKRDHAHLAHLADHDPLAGIHNRRGFERTLAQHTEDERRLGPRGSLMVLDLDHFKEVNDRLGHQAGDELLVHTAQLLRRELRATDVIARLGGDEFAILLPETSVPAAIRVGENLLTAMRAATPSIPGLPRSISASIGIASLGDHPGAGMREILRDADLAMYAAKSAGRNAVRAREPEMRSPELTH